MLFICSGNPEQLVAYHVTNYVSSSIQYRMHPDISRLPSRLFYQGRLQDGPGMAVKTQQPWHSHDMFGTYRFLNVLQGQEQGATGHSLKNKIECQVAVALYARICQEFSKTDFDFRVGVVSMYSGQIVELRQSFEQRFGRDIVGRVHFSTVDGFQGQEKDIIILSCVRAGPGLQSVGFLSGITHFHQLLALLLICSRYPADECCANSCQVFSFHFGSCSNIGEE